MSAGAAALVGALVVGSRGDPPPPWGAATMDGYVQARAAWDAGRAQLDGTLRGCSVLRPLPACATAANARADRLRHDLAGRLAALAQRPDLAGGCRTRVIAAGNLLRTPFAASRGSTLTAVSASLDRATVPADAAIQAIWGACQPAPAGASR